MTEISKAKALKKGTEREHASAWGPSPPVPGRNTSFSQTMVFSFELLSALLGGGTFHSFLVAYYYHAAVNGTRKREEYISTDVLVLYSTYVEAIAPV